MSDYCKQCSEQLFNKDYRELGGLVPEGHSIQVICECCGLIDVDHTGKCLSHPDDKHAEIYKKLFA